jgi:hypothetical protein
MDTDPTPEVLEEVDNAELAAEDIAPPGIAVPSNEIVVQGSPSPNRVFAREVPVRDADRGDRGGSRRRRQGRPLSVVVRLRQLKELMEDAEDSPG